jgi:hypothetical protein
MTEKYYKRVFAKKVDYKGIQFNSKLEADFAMFLDGKIVNYKGHNYYHKPVKWDYEKIVFELIPQETWVDKTERDSTVKVLVRNKKHTLQRVIYTPDFYLPEYNLIVEIKGYQFDDDLFRLRFRLFRHKFPNAKVWVVRSHEDFEKLDEILENLKIEGE